MIANPDRKILIMWVVAILLITRRELAVAHEMPRPHAYLGSAIVYGIAAVIAEFAGDLAVALAAGWTLAIFYQSIRGGQIGGATMRTAGRAIGPAATTTKGVSP